MFRVEEIEQTNTILHLKWKLKGFTARKVYFKLLRSRSLGEYVPFHTSTVKQNDPMSGAEWPAIDIPMKDICRNDNNRSLKIEVHEYESKVDVETTTYLAEYDFTLNYVKRHVGQYMNCYAGKFMLGMVKVASYDLSYEF